MTDPTKKNRQGIGAALGSALFLSLAPIFGKQAITHGFSSLGLVAFRTSLAALLLLLLVVIFKRSYLFIYPAGLLGCCLAGVINGIGSLLYYLALERLTVSFGQLLYSLYPTFLVIWLILDHQSPGLITYLRLALSLGGVILLTITGKGQIDWIGVCLMLAASAFYALHLPINQRVLFDIPAPTVTLYTLLAMSAITVPAYLIFDRSLPASSEPWRWMVCLTLVTFFSRLTLFLGIKHLGGIQTALLGLSELLISIIISQIWLGDILSAQQWAGAALLFSSIIMVGFEKFYPDQRHRSGGLLGWLRPPDISSKIPWGADK